MKRYIATNGNDTWSGTQPAPNDTQTDGPFATLERARAEIRQWKNQRQPGGLTIFVRGGCYSVTQTFTLTSADSGTAEAPILFCAYPGETPVFRGGVQLTGFEQVSDPAILARLPASSANEIKQVDLKTSGAMSIIPFNLGGFAGGSEEIRTFPVMELFCDGIPLPRSRWPKKDGYMRIEDVSTQASYSSHGLTGTTTGPITYTGDRPARWVDEKYALLKGYWFWDWADSYEHIASIDPVRREISFTPPYSKYGYRKGQRFCAVNLLCELEEPGEWYLDEAHGILYLYPTSNLAHAMIELSVIATPFVHFQNTEHVTLQGLTWELGAADAILIEDGHQCQLSGCTIRRCAGNGVEFRSGTKNMLQSCDLYSLGRGGAVINGGNRVTLAPGGHVVENCHIFDLSRVDRTYTPAVLADGIGHRIAHNLMHDIPSSAIRLNGNDHIVEFNEIFRVVLESDDQGGIDMFGDPTYRGNVIRNNYWHHIGYWQAGGQSQHEGHAGIRLDDAISGVHIEGNIFFHCGAGTFGAVQIHGGKDNVVIRNAFIQCHAAFSFNAWDEKRWTDFVAKALAKSKIDLDLYATRYPRLSNMAKNNNCNRITENLIYDCDAVSLRPTESTPVADNLVTNRNPGYKDAEHGDFQFSPSASIDTAPDVPSIPFERMGLYCDAHRPTLPTALIQKARSGQF